MKRLLGGTIILAALAAFACASNDAPSAERDAAAASTASALTRVYFSNKQEAARIHAGFEGAIVDTNYPERYFVLDASDAELDELEQLGFQLEPHPVQGPTLAPQSLFPDQPGYECFRTVDEIFATADQLVADHPGLAEWVDIGDSWVKEHGGSATDPELPGDDMMVLVLTNSAIGGEKPVLFATSSIHANEIAPAELTTRFAEHLLEGYGSDADATWLLDHHEIHLLLVTNPDSRRLNESGNGHRKNANDTEMDEICDMGGEYGVDLNRNFSFEWANCTTNPEYACSGGALVCDWAYWGSAAASEPETRAIQSYLQSLFANPDRSGLYIDIHSFSELVMWPYGYSVNEPADGPGLRTLGRKLASFNDYYPQASYELYGTSGTASDYAYGALGVPAFIFELGKKKLEDCAYFEQDILPKNLQALVYAAKIAGQPLGAPAGPAATSVSFDRDVVLDDGPVTLDVVLDDRQFGIYGWEPAETIAAAEYTIDVPPWSPDATPAALSASDGTFGCRDDAACDAVADNAATIAQEIVAAAATDGLVDDPCKDRGVAPPDAPDPAWYLERCEAFFAALETLEETATVSIATSGLSLGYHTVYVRGQDGNGNWGPVSAGRLAKLIRGDVNADGEVTIVDALLVAQYYVDDIPDGIHPEAGDVNCDATVDIVDALLISQFYVDAITEFPTCE